MDGANIQIVHYFDHGYLQEEKSMIHSFTVTFGAKYLTGMATSVPPYGVNDSAVPLLGDLIRSGIPNVLIIKWN